ncbi:hypothetical protein EKE94_03485 [Mesobaculum littorinae]|uniref:histidine kinase n=1 Tax=Mesobaculum littorinae TaxID=2486419 RepID=A0A438AM72_9RHOB|nr:ATP-binding protein [Mesobaculum littorinae]RVV99750.1 hypothetical protein EKE94_03485 [Mesobaculum littorinae]
MIERLRRRQLLPRLRWPWGRGDATGRAAGRGSQPSEAPAATPRNLAFGHHDDTRGWLTLPQVLVLAGYCALAVVITGVIGQLSYESYLQSLRLRATVELTEVREAIESEVFSTLLALHELSGRMSEIAPENVEDFATIAGSIDNRVPGPISLYVTPTDGPTSSYGQPVDTRSAITGTSEGYLAEDASLPMNDLVRVDVERGESGPRYVVARRPIFVDGGIWGMAAVARNLSYFVLTNEFNEHAEDYDLLILDETDPAGPPIYGDPAVLTQDPVALIFDFPYDAWRLLSVPTGGWPGNAPHYLRDYGLMALVFTTIFGGLIYMIYLSEMRRRAQLRLSDALESLDDGFSMFDREGRLIMANSRFGEIYDRMEDLIRPGVDFETVLREGVRRGQFPEAGTGPEARTYVAGRAARFREGGHTSVQRLANGRRIRAKDHRMSDGGMVSLRTDVTELERATEEAEAANTAKTRFINVLSHELRTPLTVILGNVGLTLNLRRFGPGQALCSAVEDESTPPNVREATDALFRHLETSMKTLERSGQHLLGLINEMLDFAKIESGTVPITLTLCPVRPLLLEIEEQMRPLAQAKNIALRIHAGDEVVVADRVRLTQIIFNLIGNALKFTEDGSVTVTSRVDGGRVRIAVTDTGPGIAETELASVFKAFHQVDSSYTRASKGTGLGLAISHALAEAMDGSLDLRSTLGEGSTFEVSLPAARGMAKREPAEQNPAA